MWEKIRFHPIYGLIGELSVDCLWVFSTFELFTLSTPEKLSRLPLPVAPPLPLAQRPSNACPILTSFVLPTGLWFSTRPGKSNYTGVREVDFPIIDSMLRMRADVITLTSHHYCPVSLVFSFSSPILYHLLSINHSISLSLSLASLFNSYWFSFFSNYSLFSPSVHFFGLLLLSLSIIQISQGECNKGWGSITPVTSIKVGQ